MYEYDAVSTHDVNKSVDMVFATIITDIIYNNIQRAYLPNQFHNTYQQLHNSISTVVAKQIELSFIVVAIKKSRYINWAVFSPIL